MQNVKDLSTKNNKTLTKSWDESYLSLKSQEREEEEKRKKGDAVTVHEHIHTHTNQTRFTKDYKLVLTLRCQGNHDIQTTTKIQHSKGSHCPSSKEWNVSLSLSPRKRQLQCDTTVVGTKGLTTAKLMSTDHYTDWHHVSKLRSPDRILHQFDLPNDML